MKFPLLFIPILLLVSSCWANNSVVNNSAAKTAPPATSNIKPQPQNQAPQRLNLTTTKVKFKLANDAEAFSLKPKANGLKVEGADGLEITRLTTDTSGKIKIKDPDDLTLGYVVSRDGYWKLENSEPTKVSYILRKQTNGDYKLETTEDQLLYRINRRDYGWKIENPDQKSLYKIKTRDNKISLLNHKDQVVLKTKSNFPLLAVACFGLDKLTLEQQSALAYAIAIAGE